MPTMSKQIEHLVALFHEKRNWLVLTHNDPDPDAIGAAFGMAVLLRHFRQKGQQVTIGLPAGRGQQPHRRGVASRCGD